jgi:hypothetical protein
MLAARLIDSRLPAGVPGWAVMVSALTIAGLAFAIRIPRRRRTG